MRWEEVMRLVANVMRRLEFMVAGECWWRVGGGVNVGTLYSVVADEMVLKGVQKEDESGENKARGPSSRVGANRNRARQGSQAETRLTCWRG